MAPQPLTLLPVWGGVYVLSGCMCDGFNHSSDGHEATGLLKGTEKAVHPPMWFAQDAGSGGCWLHGDIQLCRVCHHGGSPAGAPGSCPGQAHSKWAAPSHPNLQPKGPLGDSSPGQHPAAIA